MVDGNSARGDVSAMVAGGEGDVLVAFDDFEDFCFEEGEGAVFWWEVSSFITGPRAGSVEVSVAFEAFAGDCSRGVLGLHWVAGFGRDVDGGNLSVRFGCHGVSFGDCALSIIGMSGWVRGVIGELL